MRSILSGLAFVVMVSAVPAAQGLKNPSMDAQRANRHYTDGWTAIRAEAWDAAVREFEQAIESDPKFALAYYSLGRAHMGRRDFSQAIAAYTRSRELFVNGGGETFSSQLDARQRLTDKILEYRNALSQATAQTSVSKSSSQSQSVYVRELQARIARLEEARDRSINFTMDFSVPYFVPMSLGAAYFRSGRFADAEREYKEAIAANAASGETHNNLAVLYLTTGRYDEADSEVRAAEKVGFKVNENLKGDIRKKKAGGLP